MADVELWTESSLCGYADDTSSVTTDKTVEELVKKTEETVEELFKFMAVNRLVANDSKTKFCVVRKGQDHPEKVSFKIGNAEPIEKSEHEKLLGIWVSNDLKWSKHLENLAIDLNKRLFIL